MHLILKRLSAVLCAGMLTAVSAPPLPIAAEETVRIPVRSVAADFHPEGNDAVSITIPRKEHIDVLISRKNEAGESELLYRSNELHAYRNCLYYPLEPGEYDLSVSMEPIRYGPVKRMYTEHIVIAEPDADTFTHTEYRYAVTVEGVSDDDAGQPEVTSAEESLSGQAKYTDSSLVFKRYDIMQGDHDGDGVITAMDAQKTLIAFANELAGETEVALTPAQTAACDIDGNDKITAVDAQWILIYYLDSILGAEPQWPYSTYIEDAQYLYAMGTYHEEDRTVEITWIGSEWPETVDVLCSPDGETYTVETTVSDAFMYSYQVDDDFVSAYFKVAYTDDDGETVESAPFLIDANEDGITVNYPDSDGDGISDILESIFSTDTETDDTDGDGLTDGQEISLTNTDPTKYDSVLPGVSDADADCDDDDVVNRLEIEYGTDPRDADSDGDGLPDGEEVSAHTDPLLTDTDGDGLEDGFEYRYGLDPLSDETDGIADAEREIEQTIELQIINTEESPYEMSVEVTAKGDAEQEIMVSKSEYSDVLENDAQVGDIIDLSVSDFLTAETMRLKFTVDPDHRDNTLNKYAQYEDMQGIKRLSVFRYYDEINMMLPVETQYDTENNVVYADVSEPGTYAVMDLEIWFDLFDLEPEETEDVLAGWQPDHPVTKCVNGSVNRRFSAAGIQQPVRLYADTNTEKIHNAYPIDIVFIFQSVVSYYAAEAYPYTLGVLEDFTEYVFDHYTDVRVHVVQYDTDSAEVVNFGSTPYCTDEATFAAGLEAIPYVVSEEDCSTKSAFQLAASLDLRGSTNTYFYHFTVGNYIMERDYDSIVMANSGLGIFSQIIPDIFYWDDTEYPEQVHDAIIANGGIDNFLTYNTPQELEAHFSGSVNSTAAKTDYQVLLGNSLKTVKLKTELRPENRTNSDLDLLTDWQESDIRYIKGYPDGSIQLPTLGELAQNVSVDLEDILSKSGGGTSKTRMISEIRNREVLPCISDPTETDTDGDDLDDAHDHLPLIPADDRFTFCKSVDYDSDLEISWANERKIFSAEDYFSVYPDINELRSALEEISIPLCFLETLMVAIATDPRVALLDCGYSELTSLVIGTIFSLGGKGFSINNVGELKHASKAMEHFFSSTGTDVHYNAKDTCELISSSINNLEHLAYNMTMAMQYSEQLAQEGEEIYFTSTPDAELKATCFDNKGANCIFDDNRIHNTRMVVENTRHEKGAYCNATHVDWHLTIGESFGGIRAKVTRSGNQYSMTYRYCIHDIYEWTPKQIQEFDLYTLEPKYDNERLGTVLHFMHRAGLAKEYMMYGSFEGTITWTEGESADDRSVFLQIADSMKSHEGQTRWGQSNCIDEFYQRNDPDYRNLQFVDQDRFNPLLHPKYNP